MMARGAVIASLAVVARSVALVFGITVLVFVLLRIVPGDIVELMASEGGFTSSQMETVRQDLGLDRPWPEQLAIWVRNALSGDFGLSLRFQRPIAEMILAALPATLHLAALSFGIGMSLGVGTAIAAAIWPRSIWRTVVEALNVWSVAFPTFCVGFVLILVFVLWLRWTPLLGNLWLPAIVLGIDIAGQVAKPLLEDIQEARESIYVRTAMAKGVPGRFIVLRHILPNALPSLLALTGIILGGLAGGTVTMEVLFGHNGLGRLTLDSVLGRDYPLTQATVIVIASAVVLANGLVGMAGTLVDPRRNTRMASR
ncbi:DppB ABC-type dipeptide/oligopeptide/nickel transport systems, permease components [Rhabdaerophilaceae bacterium]